MGRQISAHSTFGPETIVRVGPFVVIAIYLYHYISMGRAYPVGSRRLCSITIQCSMFRFRFDTLARKASILLRNVYTLYHFPSRRFRIYDGDQFLPSRLLRKRPASSFHGKNSGLLVGLRDPISTLVLAAILHFIHLHYH